MASELKVVRDDDDDITGFEDPFDTGIPSYAREGNYSAALVSHNGFDFEEPILMHPQVALELDEAGVINIMPDDQILHEGVTVFLYEG